MSGTEGYIKFNCVWEKQVCELTDAHAGELNFFRTRMLEKNLIGMYSSGTGYGNISIRKQPYSSLFIISGSATGHLEQLRHEHFSTVTAYSLESNRIHCRGLTRVHRNH
jgi:hypothetical protein